MASEVGTESMIFVGWTGYSGVNDGVECVERGAGLSGFAWLAIRGWTADDTPCGHRRNHVLVRVPCFPTSWSFFGFQVVCTCILAVR